MVLRYVSIKRGYQCASPVVEANFANMDTTDIIVNLALAKEFAAMKNNDPIVMFVDRIINTYATVVICIELERKPISCVGIVILIGLRNRKQKKYV
jgi:hypothetical protein